MTYKERSAVYALNSYVWKLLEANLDWKKYNGLTPIIPIAQQPEMMESAKSFIVYGSAFHSPGYLYEHKKEAISYMIYCPTATEVNRVANLLTDVFERQDDAAADVNDWLVVEQSGRGSHRGVYFTSISCTMAERAEDPPEEEGGYAAGLVLIEAKFTVDKPDIKTTGFTY